MLRRSTFGLVASGGVLLLSGATGLAGTWSLAVGTLVLAMASLLVAVVLEDDGFEPVA